MEAALSEEPATVVDAEPPVPAFLEKWGEVVRVTNLRT